MEIVRPRWSSWSFLFYAGGFTVLLAATTALQYLSAEYGDAAYAGWAVFVFAVLLAIAVANRQRHRIVAGLFAVSSVGAFAALLGALWTWFGWRVSGSSSPFAGFHVSTLALELLTVCFAAALLRRFRFPLLMWVVAMIGWLFVTDLVSSGGSWSATVTLVYGLALLVAATVVDRGERRPYGFWLHAAAGLLVGGALLYWWHSGAWHWAFIAVGGVLYVGLAVATSRSSWAVLGAVGLLLAAIHFTLDWWNQGVPFFGEGEGDVRHWVPPLVLAGLGFLYLALGLAVSRRERG